MEEKLRAVLEDRRAAAGNGRPMGYQRWGEEVGVIYTVLFGFAKGTKAIGFQSLRTLAALARRDNDTELMSALASYALAQEVEVKR